MASALAGFVGFNAALLSHHMMAIPTSLFDPQCSKVFGNWLYLTYQSNIMGLVYFALALINSVLSTEEGSSVLTEYLIALFPLIFAVGSFLTIAYYALDHFNPENFRRKERYRDIYPYVHWVSHLEHGHALPLVVLHAANMQLPPTAPLPTRAIVTATVGVYMLFYLVLVHLNHHLTGLWPYAVIDDVTRAGGAALRCVFFLGLTGVFIALGAAGATLLHMR